MKAYWLIGILVAAGLRAHAENCSVNVYLAAGVPMPAGMLLDASKKATAMFREIGVNARMRIGRPARDPGDVCGAPIVVEFEKEVGYHGHADAFAYAIPYKESGSCIHVFIDRVLLHLGREPAFSNALLAHVLVHEITHVFETIACHSDEGVMKAVWSSQDYESMKRHSLPFAAGDVELIRQGLARRITHAAVE